MTVAPPAVRTVSELPGIVDFDGPVVGASGVDPTFLGSGVIACIGTDQAMIDLIPALVLAGRRVKVFEDRPRLVLPDGLDLPGRAGAVRALAGGAEYARRAASGLPVTAVLCRHLAKEQLRLERRAGSLHRRRHLADPWLRRQLTPSPHDDRAPLRGDGYYVALGAACCQLISWPIARVVPQGVRTCDGLEHHVDAIVVAR